MSRTNRTSGSSSPVKKYLSFSGSKGRIKFYDKDHPDADDKGNVFIDELDIIVLDTKSSISGYNENASAGISSNLLAPYSVGKEEFIVKTKVDGNFGVFAQGIYKDIKDKVFAIGGKFTTNVFALADFGDGYEVVKLELNGSGLSPWIKLGETFDNESDIYDVVVNMSKGQLLTRKGGKTVPVTDAEYKKVLAEIKKDPMFQRPVWFYEPSFSTSELSEDLATLAGEQDELLQSYFDKSGVKTEDPADAPVEPVGNNQEDRDDLPF